jgi:LPXTG-motif cell wall-anchored protein
MKIRRLVIPTMLALVLVVGLFTASAFAQDPDAHTPSPSEEEETDVAGVVLERQPAPQETGTPVGTEVLGVTVERSGLAATGTDTFLLAAIGVGLLGLGVLAFGVGRRRSASEGPDAAR